jgi:hypothetical protein
MDKAVAQYRETQAGLEDALNTMSSTQISEQFFGIGWLLGS